MIRRSTAVLLAVLVAGLSLAAPASAYPPGTGPTVSLGSTVVSSCTDAGLVVSGTNFTPSSTATVTLDSIVLGEIGVGVDGTFVGTATIAAGTAAGTHTIGVLAAGETASATFTVTADCAAPGLVTTGVAVASIGGLGLALLVAGGLLLMLGRRRRRAV